MGKPKHYILLSAVVLLAACGSSGNRKSLVKPPVGAPHLEPLPLRSAAPLLRLAAPARADDAVDSLIRQAESLYAAGMADFRTGNLEKSKEKFDQALSLLLESKFDVQGDDRLSAEFDRLVENIYAAEGAALEHGDVLSVQKYDPAPIESFEGLTFPVDPKVKERVELEVESVRSDFPLVTNDFVAGVINYLQTSKHGQVFIRTVLSRIGLYQPIISEALQKEDLPPYLFYLAGAESAFNPFALSRAGAKGIWQLMLARANQYGLKKDLWVDEREDPVKSTQAALRHLKDLYQMFGDWYLAMAAYNCGPVNVQKAIEKTGYADFWKLRNLNALPKETENYVPIILATALIAKDPKTFGFDVQPDPPLVTDPVVVHTPTDLRLVAQLIDRPVEEIIRLNPSLLRWTTPANNPQFVLNLPPGTKETYEQAIASVPPDRRIWWRAHKVGEGETLSSIAKKFHISARTLAVANRMDHTAPLEQGARLVVPQAPGKEASLARVRERVRHVAYSYRVRPGDNLELIADRFDVKPYQIRGWNSLKSSRLVAGKTLRLYLPAGRRTSSHQVNASRQKKSTNPHLAKRNESPTRTPGSSAGSKTSPKAVTPGA